MPDIDQIIELLGRDAADRLCRRLGGSRVYIPHALPDRDELVRETVVEELRNGSTAMSSYHAAAKRAGISVRQVQRVIAKI